MKTILVVDDEPDILLVLEILLTAEGYRVLTVSSGADALACLTRERPDVVLTDVMMPDIDGFRLSQRIMADHPSRAVPVILMSTAGRSVARKVQPPDRFISKPLDFDRLLTLVREVSS